LNLAAPTPPVSGPIDTHLHVFERNLPLLGGRRYTPDGDATLETCLAHLDRHGLAAGVLVQPSFLGTDNRYLLNALRRAGGRLRGVAVVAPDITPDELSTMASAGITGIRLNLFGMPDPDLAQPGWGKLLEQVDAFGWHVEIHVQAARLSRLLPALVAAIPRVVVDHFGRPDPALGLNDPGFVHLLRHADSGRVWVKLAAPYRNWPISACADAAGQAARVLLNAFGPQRLMWGSDWPHTEHHDRASYALALSWFDAWFDDSATRQALLADTPAALFQCQGDNP